MLEENDPAFLSEIIAILVKGMGGTVTLGGGTQIGPHELRFEKSQSTTGESYLTLHVREFIETLPN